MAADDHRASFSIHRAHTRKAAAIGTAAFGRSAAARPRGALCLYYVPISTVVTLFFSFVKVGSSVWWVVGVTRARPSRAPPLALVAVRRRPSTFGRRSFSGAPRLTAARLADWRVQILLPRSTASAT